MRTLRLYVPLIALLAVTAASLLHPVNAEEPPAAAQVAARVIPITVQGGYHPDRITAVEGERLRLEITRQEYSGCTLEIVFPTLGIRRTLPPGERVVIELGAVTVGEIPFHCGMNMTHGVIVVASKEE